jgi:hypothetical protein
MTRRLMLAVFATVAVVPLQVLAHPGHATVLGTVTTVTVTSVEVLDRATRRRRSRSPGHEDSRG